MPGRHLEFAVLSSIEDVQAALTAHRYVSDRELATSLFLSLQLAKPLLVEGEAGVGKTEIAKVMACVLEAELIRLQGYEGIDVTAAVYEWDYSRQIMAIRLAEASPGGSTPDLFGPEFLIKRPLLQALEGGDARPVVLLIDELDRADDEFDAFLLEVLSDFQVTIPEIGTIRARKPPLVIITSNRTRELHDALRRRCLYAWIDYPSFSKELAILALRAPEVMERLREHVVSFVQELRSLDIYKVPGISETIDWARSLTALAQQELDVEAVEATLGVLLKNREDMERVQPLVGELIARSGRAS
ncbi:MAG TPA: MoxR family ATPase [Chloroflexota bacterium]|nr:MoxR family ATPase [Chloroflexota bacterium]